MKHLNVLTHNLSATAGALLHTTDKKISFARNLAIGGLMCSVFVLSLSGAAEAAANLNEYSKTVSTNTSVIVDIISYMCYIGGAGLAALGIVDLKKHVENPQTPVKQGLAKLGFGGLLLALPSVTNIMQGTTGEDGAGAGFKKFEGNNLSIR